MTEQKAPGTVIIGAGIVGVSTAIWLQRSGHSVTLVDRGEPGDGTSYGNGGVLASCSVVPVTVPGLLAKAPRMLLDPKQPLFLKWSYLPRLAPWLFRYLKHTKSSETKRIAAALSPIIGDSLADHLALAKNTGAEKWIVPSDYLFIYNHRDDYENDAFSWAIRKSLGFSWDEMDATSFRSYDPVFSEKLSFAARLGDHGCIADPGRYVKDLAAHVVASGGRLLKADVEDVVREGGKVIGVRTATETIPCTSAVVATGAWSAPLSKKLGLNVPLESERGYHLELWEPNMVPRSPVMITSGKFVVTPMEGRIRLAGIVEFGGLEAPASRAPFRLLEDNIRSAMPGLTWKESSEWMGHRPAPADSIPLIGPVPGVDGAYMGFGHHHVGLTGGPKTGRLLSQMITGSKPNIDVAPYAPQRFH